MPERRHHKPYIPRADDKFRDWLNNFATVIATDPAAFFLTPADGEKLVDLAQRYEAAYLLRRRTKSKPATAAKNAARRQAWDAARPIAMRIKRNMAVTDQQKIEVGVYPPDFRGSPIPAPKHAPLLAVVEARPGLHRLRYQDATNPTRFAKPPGVVQVQLFIVIGRGHAVRPSLPSPRSGRGNPRGRARSPQRPALAGGWRERLHTATRHVFNVPHESEDCGKTATYYGRWVTERGLTGPWSAPVMMTVV